MKHLIASIMLTTGLSACAVNPKSVIVEAQSSADVSAHSDGMVAAYYLPRTRLEISFKQKPVEAPPAAAAAGKGGDAAGAKKPGDGKADAKGAAPKAPAPRGEASVAADDAAEWVLEVKNAQFEDTSRRYLLIQKSDLLSRTTLNVAKIENTDLPTSIGSEVTDNRATLITNLAAVAKVGIGLFVKSDSSERFNPVTVSWPLPEGKFTQTESDGTTTYTHITVKQLTVTVAPPPVTAYTYEEAKPVFTRTAKGFFYSACRPVTVAYDPGGGAARYVWEGKVADPDWLEFVPYPRKGKIAFHSQCGSSLTTEKDPTLTTDSLISTAVAQAAAVFEAYEKAKKE